MKRRVLEKVPWKLVRLEHAPTGSFPAGSAIRAYFLHLPLRTNGRIDHEAHASYPMLATMRRYWPCEPDRSGYVVREEERWLCISDNGKLENDAVGWFEDCSMTLGGVVEIVEPVCGAIPFTVAAVDHG